MSKRITLDNLKTFLTQLKTHITDPITNDVSTLTTKVRNAENNIITANSNISSVQQALNDKADKNHNHVTTKYSGVTWTPTIQVGTWSALCNITAYDSFILSITTNNGLQCGFDTFIVSTGYKSARIYQLGNNGYTLNSSYQLRLVKNSDFAYTLEIKNDYSYNGATTSNIECRYIVTSNHDYITTYSGAFVASTNNDVVYSITTSPNYMVGTISNAIKDSEGNIIKDTYYHSGNINNNKFALQVNVKHYINNSELLTYVDADNTQMQFKKSGLYKITVTKPRGTDSGISFCDTSLDFETRGKVLVGDNMSLYRPKTSSLVMYIDKTKTYEFFGFVTGTYQGATTYTKQRGTEFKTNLQGTDILIELIKEC